MKKFILLTLLCAFGYIIAYAQGTVRGTVNDVDGNPLPGASVLVKGTTKGTVTDIDGNYTLTNVPSNATLVYSFVGMENQEIPVNGRSSISITLQEGTQLEEVIVTALGIKRNARDLTYAVQSVEGDKLENKIESDVIRTLEGKVAGINVSGSGGAPGSSTNIIIRGNSSLLGSNQPLFVIDGVPFDNSRSSTQNLTVYGSSYSNRALDINPNDIESINVLKGGSAAALYGSRAANGVILITTKSGKGSGKRLNVSVSTTFGVEHIATLPDYQNEYGQGAADQGDGNVFTFNSGYYGTWGPRFDDPDLDGNGSLFDNNGVISYVNHLGETVPYKAFPNNVKDFFDLGKYLEYSVSVSGGDENTDFILSFSGNDHDSFIPYSDLKRYSLKLAGNHKISEKLTIGGSVNYVKTSQLGIPIGGFGIESVNTFSQLWIMPRSYNLSGFPYIDPDTKEGQHYRTDEDNPYYVVQENNYTSLVDRVFGNLKANYKVNDWLEFNGVFGYNTYTDRRQQIYAKSTQYNGGIGAILEDDLAVSELDANIIANIKKDLTEDISFTGNFGWNVNQIKSHSFSVEGTTIIVHGIDNIDNTIDQVSGGNGSAKTRLLGVYGDATWGYKDWVFLNLVGRNDWSSTLPKKNNSYFYYGASASVILSDALGDSFENNILKYWKIYGGTSKVGNDPGAYSVETTYNINPGAGNNLANLSFPFNSLSAISLGNAQGNPELKPEFSNEIEVGTEMRFKDNIFTFDFTYYSKKSTDQIFGVTAPASSGFIAKVVNAGEITNKGIELHSTISPPIKVDGLKWNIDVTFSKNKSKVVELFGDNDGDGEDDVQQISIGTNFIGFDIVNKVGYPYGVLEGSVFRRDDEGNLLIHPETGRAMTADDVDIISDPNPEFISSLSNSISYKGFNLSFLFNWRKGGDLYSNTISGLRSRGVVEETAINRESGRVINGYVADINDLTQPALDANGNKIPNTKQITTNDYYFRALTANEFDVFDATVFRLRELSLGYNFPTKWLEKTPFKSANITFVGRNLWMYAPNIPHIDPEVNGYGAGNRQGIDYFYMPTGRRYAINLKANF